MAVKMGFLVKIQFMMASVCLLGACGDVPSIADQVPQYGLIYGMKLHAGDDVSWAPSQEQGTTALSSLDGYLSQQRPSWKPLLPMLAKTHTLWLMGDLCYGNVCNYSGLTTKDPQTQETLFWIANKKARCFTDTAWYHELTHYWIENNTGDPDVRHTSDLWGEGLDRIGKDDTYLCETNTDTVPDTDSSSR